jgi:DtxR family manganese transport transcriptional regulator
LSPSWRALGISSPAARADAEGIERHVSKETLAAFEKFIAARVPRSTLTGLVDDFRRDD